MFLLAKITTTPDFFFSRVFVVNYGNRQLTLKAATTSEINVYVVYCKINDQCYTPLSS